MTKHTHSWGHYPACPQQAVRPAWQDQIAPLLATARNHDHPVLPFGMGRSYGDSCMGSRDHVIQTTGLNHMIEFNPLTGRLHCESGVTLDSILQLIVPQGWFLPVTPGTRFITVGGAIANDVHGKNHHLTGTFGQHVKQFMLQRSDGQALLCSPDSNSQLYAATIAGLGLTGVILWAELQLKKITNSALNVETIRYNSLREFFQLSAESAQDYEYTVAWIDCLAKDKQLGRGHFMRANHATASTPTPAPKGRKLSVPLMPPISLINPLSLRLFNSAYYHRQQRRSQHAITGYDPFFYPLDGIHQWNRIYGPRGFQQYQCVIPHHNAEAGTQALLEAISTAGTGSFLAVLKVFGDKPSPGLLSFPRPGATLALDFPRHETRSPQLFDTLDRLVHESGGAIYPAKDSHTPGHYFREAYPHWQQLEALRDPALQSRFWQRLTD